MKTWLVTYVSAKGNKEIIGIYDDEDWAKDTAYEVWGLHGYKGTVKVEVCRRSKDL